MTTQSAAIDVDALSKTYTVRVAGKGVGGALKGLFSPETREVAAVAGVSFRVEPGERVAFVGPNGAGKSTTIKMLCGILSPTVGRARVLGLDPARDRKALAYRIGTVFGQRSQLWYHLPAHDSFELLARVYDLDLAVYRRRRNELVERFGVGPLLDKPVRQLSLGERMRCEVVASLLHQPEILFLDEPTIGLDVTAKAAIRELVRDKSREEGSTVLLTSHDTGDVERVCDRIVVINAGRLILDQQVGTLRSTYIRRKYITVKTVEAMVDVDDEPGTTVIERRPHELKLALDVSVGRIETLIQSLLRKSGVADITIEDPPMEEIVKLIYGASP